jgi:hypothetical protein
MPEAERFLGTCAIYPTLCNGHTIRILYKDIQLEEAIYPDMRRAFQEGGFEARDDLWDVLNTVAVGGPVSLKGPSYPNPKHYKPDTMKEVFMRPERTLAHALMTAVFCKQVPYGCSPISFKEVNGSFKFDTNTAFRRATHVFLAETGSEKDLYRITIEGAGNDLSKHRFTFEPSLTWLCRRYPEKTQGLSSIVVDLGSNSTSVSDLPQQVASGKPAAAETCGRGGRDGEPELSAESEPTVRDLKSKSEFVSKSYTAVLCRSGPDTPGRSRKICKRRRSELSGSRQLSS